MTLLICTRGLCQKGRSDHTRRITPVKSGPHIERGSCSGRHRGRGGGAGRGGRDVGCWGPKFTLSSVIVTFYLVKPTIPPHSHKAAAGSAPILEHIYFALPCGRSN